MYYLIAGFIAPAIIFAILGLIACLRRNSIESADDEKEYQSIEESTNRRLKNNSVSCVYDEHGIIGYQTSYQNRHFHELDLPPSYSEALNLKSAGLSCKSEAKHIPPNQPKILPEPAVHSLVQIY